MKKISRQLFHSIDDMMGRTPPGSRPTSPSEFETPAKEKGESGSGSTTANTEDDEATKNVPSELSETEISKESKKEFKKRVPSLIKAVQSFNQAAEAVNQAMEGNENVQEVKYRFDDFDRAHHFLTKQREFVIDPLPLEQQQADDYLQKFDQTREELRVAVQSYIKSFEEKEKAELAAKMKELREKNFPAPTPKNSRAGSPTNTNRDSIPTTIHSEEEEDDEEKEASRILHRKKKKQDPTVDTTALMMMKFMETAETRSQKFQENQLQIIQELFLTAQSRKFDVKELCPVFKDGDHHAFMIWRARWLTCEEKMKELKKTPEEMYFALTSRLEGDALKTAQCQVITDESYERAMKKLTTSMLDRQQFLRETMRKITTFPKMIDKAESLQKSHDDLRDLWDSFGELALDANQIKYLFFMGFIEPKISAHTRELWQQEKAKAFKENPEHPLGGELSCQLFFDTLMVAKRDAAAAANYLPKNEGGEEKQDKYRNRSTLYGSQSTSTPQVQGGDDGYCIFCKVAGKQVKQHGKQLWCKELGKLGPDKCWKVVKNEKNGISCFLCLGADGHKAFQCPGLAEGSGPGLKPCNIPLTMGENAGKPCNKKHCRFLHFERDPNRQQANRSYQARNNGGSGGGGAGPKSNEDNNTGGAVGGAVGGASGGPPPGQAQPKVPMPGTVAPAQQQQYYYPPPQPYYYAGAPQQQQKQ